MELKKLSKSYRGEHVVPGRCGKLNGHRSLSDPYAPIRTQPPLSLLCTRIGRGQDMQSGIFRRKKVK